MKPSTNKNYTGAPLYAVGDGVRVRRLKPNGTEPNMATAGISWVRTRGQAVGTATGRQLVPTKGPGWLEVRWGLLYGWIRFDLVTKTKPTAAVANDGQALVLNILARDNRTAQELLVSGALLGKAEAKGADVKRLRQRYAAVYATFTARRAKMLADERLKFSTTADPGLAPLVARVGGIGVLPAVWALWAVGSLVVVGVSWSLIAQHYAGDGKVSEDNLMESAAIRRAVELLGPVEGKKLLTAIQDKRQKAYTEGHTEAAAAAETSADTGIFANLTKLLKWGGGLYLATKLF